MMALIIKGDDDIKYFDKEKQEYSYKSRYKLLTKMINEAGYEVTLLSFCSDTDMYLCRIQIDNKTIQVYYTDEQVKEFYHNRLEKERIKKARHKDYIKNKKK